MEWYRNQIGPVEIVGLFSDSCVRIMGLHGEDEFVLFEKFINFWKYEEVLSEDLLRTYRGKILKIEKSIPTNPDQLELWLEVKNG